MLSFYERYERSPTPCHPPTRTSDQQCLLPLCLEGTKKVCATGQSWSTASRISITAHRVSVNLLSRKLRTGALHYLYPLEIHVNSCCPSSLRKSVHTLLRVVASTSAADAGVSHFQIGWHPERQDRYRNNRG